MHTFGSIAARVAPLLLVAMAGFGLDVSTASAQSASCQQLQRQLNSFERNADFQQSGNASQQAKRIAAQVQKDESAYVRTGCNDLAKAGAQLPRECRNLARKILDGRAEYENVSRSVNTASAIAQQREAVLQEIARYGCNTSQANVTNQDRPRRRTLFEELFGGYREDEQVFGDGDLIGDQFSGYGGYGTIRTVCVRKSDGYFWPISYSTLQEYVGNDAQMCQEQCPGTEVELYYYSNPGQEPEEMVSISGEPYASLPTAFAYRNAFDTSARCKVASASSGGNISVVTSEDGKSRAFVTLNDQTFPMPIRDPRAPAQVTAAPVQQVANAVYVDVPLPRPRPLQAGEVGPIQATAAAPVPAPENRIVTIAGKTVRIVGPDTPYARLGEAGT